MGVVGVLAFLEETPVDSGLGGRLVIRPSPRGGCGKEFMLTVFLIVLPAALNPDADLGWGRATVGAGVVGGRNDDDGARRPVLGVFGVDLLTGTAKPPVLFRVLPIGRAGSATVGGPFDGRDGRGSAVDISRLWLLGYGGSTWCQLAGICHVCDNSLKICLKSMKMVVATERKKHRPHAGLLSAVWMTMISRSDDALEGG